MNMRFSLFAKSVSFSILAIAVICGNAKADWFTYVDRSDFLAAGGIITDIDFETSLPGPIPSGSTVSGITFNYNFAPAVDLTIENSFATTSGTNYLGSSDSGVLQDGDDFSFSFNPVSGFGLYVISQDPLFDGDFTLTAGGNTASLSASSVQQVLIDGSFVWFLGIRSNTTVFSSATLETNGGGGNFLYNLDDIVTAQAVPEPSSIILSTIAIAGFGFRQLRRGNLTKRKKK